MAENAMEVMGLVLVIAANAGFEWNSVSLAHPASCEGCERRESGPLQAVNEEDYC